MNLDDTMPALRPEFALLLHCARTAIEPARVATIRRLLQTELSWEFLRRQALAHNVFALVYGNLARHGPDLCPGGMLESWKPSALAILGENSRLLAELLELVTQFRLASIPLAAFKGPVAAVAHFHNLALRSFVDLDLLIMPEHLRNAGDLLGSRGYTRHLDLDPVWERLHTKNTCERLFVRENPQYLVDLHWGLLDSHYAFEPDMPCLWNRLKTVNFGGVPVATLGDLDTLIYLCLHGAKHNWASLSQVVDLAEFLRTHPEIHWDEVFAWAETRSASRLLHLGLQLAHRLLEVHLPADILTRVKRDPHALELAQTAIGALLDREQGTSVWTWARRQSLFLRAMERNRDRLRHLHLLVRPYPPDLHYVRLPVFLAPVYYGVRPIRLLRKYLRAGRSTAATAGQAREPHERDAS